MKELHKADIETQKILNKHRKYGKFVKIGEYDDTRWKIIL